MEKFDYAKYLSELLIIQYSYKPRASETIKAIGKMFPVDIILQVRDSFDLETATGVSLDILAKYIGVSRSYINDDDEIAFLTDEEFRTLIKFKAIANTSNSSHYDIDTSLYRFFGNSVRAHSDGGMEMTFFVPVDAQNVIIAALQQNALPTPIGVLSNQVVVQEAKFFGFVNYQNQYAFYKTGFRDYNNPDKEGEMLNYEKVKEV